MRHVHPFVNDPRPLSKLTESKVYKLREQLNQGKTLNEQDLKWLTDNNQYGTIKSGGWSFDFADILHEYWVYINEYIERFWAHDENYLESVILNGDAEYYPTRIVDVTMYEKMCEKLLGH